MQGRGPRGWADTGGELRFPQLPAWGLSGCGAGVGKPGDRAGGPRRPGRTEFVLQGRALCSVACDRLDPAGSQLTHAAVCPLPQPWAAVTAFSVPFHGWKDPAQLQVSRVEPDAGPGPTAGGQPLLGNRVISRGSL